jgi:phosphoribosyl-ATP pyrophosphohydrolase
VKSFDELFAELSGKVASGEPGSGTVQAVKDGVHAAGKKVVEEASEAWIC